MLRNENRKRRLPPPCIVNSLFTNHRLQVTGYRSYLNRVTRPLTACSSVLLLVIVWIVDTFHKHLAAVDIICEGCAKQSLDVCRVGYFRTTGYDSRIYVYEKNLMYNFYYPSFSGEGMRMNVIGKWDICKTVSLSAKMGLTKYFDRSVISSGNQKIDGSCQSDLDIQVVVRI